MHRSNSNSYRHRPSRSPSPCYRPISRTTNSDDNSPHNTSNMNSRFRTTSKDPSEVHSTVLSRIDPGELKGIKVSIKRNIPIVITPPPIQRALDNPDQLVICRKEDEGLKPLFERDDVIPNLEPKIIEERTITASTSFQKRRTPSADHSPERNYNRMSRKEYKTEKYPENEERSERPRFNSARDNRLPRSPPYFSETSDKGTKRERRSSSRDERHHSTRPKSTDRHRSPKWDERYRSEGSKRSPRRDEHGRWEECRSSPRREERSRPEGSKTTRSPRRDNSRNVRSPRRDSSRSTRSPRRDDKYPRSVYKGLRSPKKEDRSPRRRDDRSPKRRDDRSPRRNRRSRSPRDYKREYSNRDRDRYEYERKHFRSHRERSRSRPRNHGYFKPSPGNEMVRIRPEMLFPPADPNRYWPPHVRGDMYFPKDPLQHGIRWMGPPVAPPVMGPGPPIIPPRPYLGPIMPPFRPRFPPQPRIQYNSLTSYKLETSTSASQPSTSNEKPPKDESKEQKKKTNSDTEGTE